MTTEPVVLSVQALDVPFGDRPGLIGISLDVRRGERLALLGPSGSGKSSTLRTLAGLARPRGGRVSVHGADVTHVEPGLRRVVYLHQEPQIFTHLSVIENVAFPLEVRGIARAQALSAARDLLRNVQLEALADRSARALSGGQRHRVALARALAADPVVLLLDEPFASLDPSLRHEVRDAVLGVLRERSLAAILVTHDVDEAVAFADRIALLLDGTLAQVGEPGLVMQQPASLRVARFLGIPNLIAGARDASGRFRCAIGEMTIPGDAGPAVLVARADALLVTQGTGFRVVREEERTSGTRVHVQAPGAQVIGIPAPGLRCRPGDDVAIQVDWSRVHLVPGDAADV